MDAGDQFHVPVLSAWGNGSAVYLIGGWVGYRVFSFVGEKMCCFFLESNHNSSFLPVSQSLYRTGSPDCPKHVEIR